MPDDVLEFPQHRRDRLVAHLLGDGDAIALDLAVGVVGADTDKDAALPADQHELDLAAGIATGDFDAVGQGQSSRSNAVEYRRRRGPRDAERLEFGDVPVA